jgi:hypothetical protein
MHSAIQSYNTWKDFFSHEVGMSGHFELANSVTKGSTDIEVYRALTADLLTTIEVGYLNADLLIYMHILNPKTPAKNRQQQLEHFYQLQFVGDGDYGDPGLEFNICNVASIRRILQGGFYGEEKVYLKNGKPIKSILTTRYYPDSPEETRTYNFSRGGLWEKLFRSVHPDEVRRIDLRGVFPGLNGG